ncbi:peroxisomal hydratase-dehydrogenase-epimerase-like [Leguminivora glycinivorella]|uniref:peroxisomal hydratase-dehydrogenase-epimerase-like n=1 Tax=Leguminivora glycinivorella TaxID=1035111 RepID=UPI00200F979E|nr:peroxisomal hydratase-dehydrogenase-epimerase-like [Leguminivora glycinivorella]
MAEHGDIKGKTFLITGAASGLGALYAEAFLREGAKHIAILDVAEAKGKETAQQLNKTYPGKVTFIKCDVGDEDNISKSFNQVVDTVKQLDVVINNAGILNDSPDVWRKSCDVNWQGLVSFSMRAVQHMRKDEGRAGGTIVNIASIAAVFPIGSIPIYCGSKAAVLHFSQSLSQAPFEETTGIRVLTICFGATDTALMKNLAERVYSEQFQEEFLNLIPNNAIQKAESAVEAFILMFKNASNGSVWLSKNNQPVQDITPKIHDFYNSFTIKILIRLKNNRYNIKLTHKEKAEPLNHKYHNMAGLADITGKTCLITGGASGLGALYANAFLREGAKYVAILDIAEAKGKETAEQLNSIYPGKVAFIKCEVGEEESISKSFNQVVDTVKRLDVVINNAGIFNDSPTNWRKSCDVNWQGLVSFSMRAVKHMRKAEGGAGGTIVNIASVAALRPTGCFPIYCASKAAVLHFSQSLSQVPFEEITGIRVLTICLGPTDTAIMENLADRRYDKTFGNVLLKRITQDSLQKTEPAVAALITMFKNGTNGSVWMSENNQPVQDITPKIQAFYNSFAK